MKKNLLFIVCAAFLALLFYGTKTNAQCSWTHYNMTNSSLVSNEIGCLEFDTKGNLWILPQMLGKQIGTEIQMFDGVNWNTYSNPNQHMVFDIILDIYDNVWCGTYEGLLRFDGVNWTKYDTLNSGLNGTEISAVGSDHQGNMWVSSYNYYNSNEEVQKFDGEVWTSYTTADGLLSDYAEYIVADTKNNIWLASSSGLSKFDGGKWDTITHIDTIPLQVNFLEADKSGNIWLVTSYYDPITYLSTSFLCKYDGVNWTIYKSADIGIASDYFGVTSLIEDKNGNIWLGANMGAFKYDGNQWIQYDSNDGLASDYIKAIAADSDGAIWFGTSMGISKFKETATLFVTPQYNQGMNFMNQEVTVELYSMRSTTGVGFDLVESKKINLEGYAEFYDIPLGSYYVKSHLTAKSPNLLSTYYDSSYTWSGAMIYPVDSCGSFYLEMNMFEITPPVEGPGVIRGMVTRTKAKKTKLVGEPVPGADIYLEQEPEGEPIMHTVTDDFGHYVFNNIPLGQYSITVDIAGVGQKETYDVDVTADDDEFTDLNFIVDTSGIYKGTVIIGIEDKLNDFAMKLYPNPVDDYVILDYVLDKSSTINVSIFDLTGRDIGSVINENKVPGHYVRKVTLDKYNLKTGIYFISIKVNNDIYIKKLLKTE